MDDGTPWLDDEQIRAWRLFAAVLEMLPAALNSQLERDEHLNHAEYYSLAMLSEAPDQTLRASALAARTNATLPRLSRVVNRLVDAGYVRREPCATDRRATNLVLTDAGWAKVVRAAPAHVRAVRGFVVDALTSEQLDQLRTISSRILATLDPAHTLLEAESETTKES